MKAAILTTVYWILNLTIIFAGIVYAFRVWQEKRRALFGALLFTGGVIWHAIRGMQEYEKGACVESTTSENWLLIANNCIPHTSQDIVFAQIAIFTGIFVFIALVAKRMS